MDERPELRCTAFAGPHRIAAGTLPEVAVAIRRTLDAGAERAVLAFDDATGRVVDLDLRGTDEEVHARASAQAALHADASLSGVAGAGNHAHGERHRSRGRPRLGVVSREVTLLPRHWAWLATQRGGASATLRRLVDEARKVGEGQDRVRRAQDAAYRFMSAMGGDLPGYEEALRALFAGNAERFDAEVAGWPHDVRDHARHLAAEALVE